MESRVLRRLAPRLGALAVVAALVALAVSAIASGRPAAQQSASAAGKATACPFKGGTIRWYMAEDLKAVIGEEIGPAGVAAANVWRDYTNAHGGVLGCKVAFDVQDEAFGNDVTTCIRDYRTAIAAKKYDFFVGPTNSACMFSLSPITNAAHVALISGIAADHEPYMEQFGGLNFHPSVSTFLEGRASAVAAKKLGWKRVAVMVPNYAYGQDAGKAFQAYFKKIVAGGTVVAEQEPPFNEKDFTKYINAMVAGKPDGVFTAFFGPFVVPFWKQWKATGNDKKIENICGLGVLATFVVTKSAADIPAKTYCYNRAPYELLGKTKIGAALSKLYLSKYGKKHPLVSEFAFQMFSSLQLAKALIERTKSLDPQAWRKTVEAGDFSFQSPYHSGPTYINPINHMADSCVSVGQIVWNAKVPYGTTYDPKTFITSCMHNVLDETEAKELTKNPGVSEAAIKKYYSLATKTG